MPDPFTIALASYIATNAPRWLEDLRNTLLDKSKEAALTKGKAWLDERAQQRLLQETLHKAAKRGLVKFRKLRERDQYKAILTNLFEPGEHSVTMRRAAMTLFSLSDTPNLAELNAIYNQSLRSRNSSQTALPAEVDAAPYLVSFFDALLVELYDSSFFKSQVSDVIQARAALLLPKQVAETNTTLHEIHQTLTNAYTDEQFQQDVATYTTYVERTLRNLKIVGFLPKDYNKDPEINGIFVPLNVALSEPTRTEAKQAVSLIALLQQDPHLVLLGDPGSGKSTTVRHLAWSHAWANLPNTGLGDVSLLPDQPLPLRIELRLFMHDYKQHPDYSFLSYATDVLMKHSVNILMFERLLAQQRMLILFDGLDEVTTLDERQRLVQEIEHFVRLYPNSYTLVTSRPVGYSLASCSQHLFTHANVQGFDDNQIHQFLERWYKCVLGLSPLPDQEQQELETLFTTLKENTRLHKLAENPLLLTVITGLYRSQRLPEKRVQVYDKCAELLLETWAKLKGTDIRWADMKMGRDDQFDCVAHLGFQLHYRSQEVSATRTKRNSADTATDVPAKVIRREIENFLRSRKLITELAEQRKEAELFLRLMQEEAGLIVERGTDENGESIYGFVHRTFQEYFAASDVYKRYEQDEEPTIIHDFLEEHLHDPHWREVILLLLGKLGRRRVTVRLRQILDGKIKSRRSHYTEILQQDLFFVCDCLIDEMDIESDLAEAAVSRLSNLVITSPFSPQRVNALEKLAKLVRTKQFAYLGKRELVRLMTLDTITDIELRIQIAGTLYASSPGEPKEQKLATQQLLQIAQRPNLTTEQSIQAAHVLCKSSPVDSDEEKLAVQQLLEIARRTDVPVEQAIEAAQALYESRLSASEDKLAMQQLLQIARRTDMPVEQAIEAAQALYRSSPRESEEKKLAAQQLLQIARRADVPIEQTIQAAEALYGSSPVELKEKKLAAQQLLQIARRTDVPVEQTIQAAEALYWSSPRESEERELATRQLLHIAQRSDLTIEQKIQAIQAFYILSPRESEERKLAVQQLMEIAQRPDLTVEQKIQAIQALYEPGPSDLEKWQQVTQLLWQLAQDPGITAAQHLSVVTIPIAKYHANYKDKLRALQVLYMSLPSEQITDYLEAHWPSGYYLDLKEVPDIVAVLKQKLLPTRVRDRIFDLLNSSIPQFNEVPPDTGLL